MLWLGEKPLVLASRSGVRATMLRHAGVPVEIDPADIDERAVEQDAGVLSPMEAAALLAREKARAVSQKHPQRIVLGCDQTLALGARRFDKPADRQTVREHLHALRGKTHVLSSAAALVRDGAVLAEVADEARLAMREFSDEFLNRYLDAAGNAATSSVGGYQLEGMGAHLFDTVEGSHFTVLGLPLLPLLDALRKLDLVKT